MRDLRGKTAIVTGGGVRLGRALAERLAREGMNVCISFANSRDAAFETFDALERYGVRRSATHADFTDPVPAAQRLIASAQASYVQLDVLVNCAAIFEPGTLADTDEANWDRHLNINLKAPAFLCREFAKCLAPGRTAQIVNVVDWRALRPGVGHLAYTVSKAGLVALTKILAQELAPRIQVNAIAPGAILPAPGATPEQFEAIGCKSPLQRTGHPDDIADALVYLLQSEYITGEVLNVAGGQQL